MQNHEFLPYLLTQAVAHLVMSGMRFERTDLATDYQCLLDCLCNLQKHRDEDDPDERQYWPEIDGLLEKYNKIAADSRPRVRRA
jgi:hypothetical protein